MTDFLSDEIARTRREAVTSTRRMRGWLALTLLLTVAASGALTSGWHTTSAALTAWSLWALWGVAVCARAAEDDAEIVAWLGGAS